METVVVEATVVVVGEVVGQGRTITLGGGAVVVEDVGQGR